MTINYRTTFCWILMFAAGCSHRPGTADTAPSVSGFLHWRTGHDAKTIQILPDAEHDVLELRDHQGIAHVKFQIASYGEVSFPIDVSSDTLEARSVDLSDRRHVSVTYKANHNFVLQLRQTGVHGGRHNHVVLPPSPDFTTVTIPFTDFRGGVSPLDLSDVGKFNFAFLANNPRKGFAELWVSRVEIDGYRP